MKTKHSIEKSGWELITKYLSREATAEEQEALETWATLSEQNKRELEEAKALKVLTLTRPGKKPNSESAQKPFPLLHVKNNEKFLF